MGSPDQRTAIYARVSTGSEDQDRALHQQLARLRAAAAPDTPLEYVDVMSGTREDRPALTKLLQDCHSGLISRVLVTRIDRATRSVQEGARLVRYFSQDSSPQLISLDDGLELRSVSGRFFAQILLAWAQAESERVSERTLHGKAHARRQLRPLCPIPPFGYQRSADGSHLVPHPEQWDHARYAIDWFLEHRSMRALLREMAHRLGRPWLTQSGVRQWLLNPTLCGACVYGTTTTSIGEDGKKHRQMRPAGEFAEVHPGAHQALISEVEYARIVAIIRCNQSRNRAQIASGYVRELTGLVKCGHCGHSMHYHYQGNNRPPRLRCKNPLCSWGYRNTIPPEVVSSALIAKLREQASMLATMGHAEEMQSKQAIPAEAWELQQQIKTLEAMADPDVAGVLQSKRLRLEALIVEAQPDERCEFSLEQSREALASDAFWQQVERDPQQKRNLFTQLVKRVVVSECRVEQVETQCIPGS